MRKKQLTDLSRTDPKKFCKRVNCYRQSKQYNHADIDANQFRDYFSEMLNDPVRMDSMSNDFSSNNEAQVNIECLDKPFEENEILKIISWLGKNKAADRDIVFSIDDQLFFETLMMLIRGKTIAYASEKKKQNIQREELLIKEIENVQTIGINNLVLLEEKNNELLRLRKDKLEGSLIRSRAKWVLEGEKTN